MRECDENFIGIDCNRKKCLNNCNNKGLCNNGKCLCIKNYEGDLIRKNKTFKKYRFYNEREWRYVPVSDLLNDFPNALAIDKYLNDKPFFNELAGRVKLTFYFSDISYIILKKEEEIPLVSKHLKKTYKNICTSKDLEILLTKITTVNQIRNDF